MNLKLTYLPVKCLLALSYFKQNQKVSTKFSKNSENQFAWKSVQIGNELFRAGGRKDMTRLMAVFSQLLRESAQLFFHATWQA
jgi:hypothetical protein